MLSRYHTARFIHGILHSIASGAIYGQLVPSFIQRWEFTPSCHEWTCGCDSYYVVSRPMQNACDYVPCNPSVIFARSVYETRFYMDICMLNCYINYRSCSANVSAYRDSFLRS